MRDSSHHEVSRYLDRYASSLHGLPASAIDRKRIADLLDTIAREHGAISANRARAALSAMFGWAIRRGLHDNNPVIGTEQSKEHTRDRVLSDAELAAIWNATGDTDFDNIVRLLILTGQRATEIAGLRWNEISFDEDLISLPAAHQERTSAFDSDVVASARNLKGRAAKARACLRSRRHRFCRLAQGRPTT